MKLLIIYADKFGYKTSNKGLESAKTVEEEIVFTNSIVAFIHFEERDEEILSVVETKMIKQLKWAARKNETNKIILHSFAHLSESKGSPELTIQLFNSAEERLKNSGQRSFSNTIWIFFRFGSTGSGPLIRETI